MHTLHVNRENVFFYDNEMSPHSIAKINWDSWVSSDLFYTNRHINFYLY